MLARAHLRLPVYFFCFARAREMHALYACVLPPAPFCPYSHLPLTGSHRPPISMAHLDWIFLQPLSATAALDAKIEAAAAAATAAPANLHFMVGPPNPT